MAVYFSSKLPGRGTPVPSPPSMRPSCALPSVQALTVSEAIQRLKSCTPALLGLSGASMEEYEVYAEEGLVLVDSSPCLQLNVYSSTPRQYRGCYLMTVDGAHLYQLDRDASQVTELTPYSNTAVK